MSDIPPGTMAGANISKGFMAALIKALKGEDKEAADILRSMANEIVTDFDKVRGQNAPREPEVRR